MIVVFEGPDNAGKSTLAKLVAEELGFNYRGRIVRVGPELVEEANKKDLDREGNWILDRCYWMSDLIYEPIYSGRTSVFFNRSDEELPLKNIVYVHVTCDQDTLKQRFAEVGDDIYNIDAILLARFRYRQLFEDFKGNVITINTSEGSIQQNKCKLLRAIKRFL